MVVRLETTGGIEVSIVEFCRFARASGFNAGVEETLTALDSIRVAGAVDRLTLKAVLRAVLCSSKDEWDRFQQLFEEFWSSASRRDRPKSRVKYDTGTSDDESEGQTTNTKALGLYSGEATSSVTPQEGKSVSGASALERNRKADFSVVSGHDLKELERLAERLLEQMSLRLSRRLRFQQQGRVDLRRTIRASMGSGGYPVELRFRGHRREQPRLLILIDVSGSMDPYSLFLLRFAFALQKHFHRARTFIFSTGPIEITAHLSTDRLDKAFKMLGGMPAGWSGGTRIGDSLAELGRAAGAKLFSRDTLFIIFSDGLETGDPGKLAAEMRAIKRKVRKVIWLNPLAGMRDYEPVARGMRAALPYVDCLAAADSLQSLLRLEKVLGPAVLM